MNASQSNTSKFHLIIQANSPGELIAWVQPIAKAFKEKCPNAFITLALVPCQYATKREADVGTSFSEIDEVFTVKQTMKSIFTFKKFNKKAETGAVLFCGGDPMYAKLLARKTSFPAYAYTEHKRNLGNAFKRIFYKHKDGDLMTARIRDFKKSRSDVLNDLKLPDLEYVLIQPASRPQYFSALIPYFSDVVKELHQLRPKMPILLSQSEFTTEDEYQRLQKALVQYNCLVLRGKSLDLMKISKLMLSIPGTNTAEAMYMNLPMLTVFPAQFAYLTPLDGLLGLIKYIPIIGSRFQDFITRALLKRAKFISLPNIMAKEVLTPQLIQELPAKDCAKHVVSLFEDNTELLSIKDRLSRYNKDQNVDELICDVILPI